MADPRPSAPDYSRLDPDVRLMLQVREDNAAAFDELVLKYQGRLLTILEHLLGRRDQAEDVAQEVFLRIYRARKNYAPEARFSTWLFTIANNTAANALRLRSRRSEVQADVRTGDSSVVGGVEYLAQATSGAMPARVADKAELHEMVRAALSALNERQRMAVLLNKFEEMSYADIAAAMQISSEAVKSLLSRARTTLRSVLEPYLLRGEMSWDGTNGSSETKSTER